MSLQQTKIILSISYKHHKTTIYNYDSRGFPFSNEDTRQRQFERGLHHFDRQRLQLQRQVSLGRRRTGKPLQVDVCRGQHLTMPLVLLHMTDRNNHDMPGVFNQVEEVLRNKNQEASKSIDFKFLSIGTNNIIQVLLMHHVSVITILL